MDQHDVLAQAIANHPALSTHGFVGDPGGALSAWTAIARMDAPSVAKPSSLAELADSWTLVCRTLRLLDPSGEVLLSLGGYGGLPWLYTSCASASALLSVRAPRYSDIEIVIVDPSIERLAAITTEEDHYLVFAGRKAKDNDWQLSPMLSAF